MNLKGEKSLIEIKLCTARNWLHRLGFKYKNVKKPIFINEYKQLDMVKDCKRFLKIRKELKLYIIEFNKDSIMKNKKYPFDCVISERIQ